MNLKTFDQFLANRLADIQSILGKKSADYSDGDDKLFNFKLAASMDGITPIESLRGMHLKHISSIRQGLDDLQKGKVRSWEWWQEKEIDNINYSILLLALIYEEYFNAKTTPDTKD